MSEALAGIFEELDRNPSLAAYAAAERKLRKAGLPPLRLAILANHTFEIGAVLAVECARRGFWLDLYKAGYDQYRQEMLGAASGLHPFQPDAVLVSLHLENTFPGLTTRTVTEPLPDAGEWVASFRALLTAYRETSRAAVFVQDFLPPVSDMSGLLAAAGACSVFDWVMALNEAIRRMAASIPSVFVIDAARLACESGLAGWRDARLFYLAGAGINPRVFPRLAARIARHLAALRRPPAKCLVLDLDNTLWGGILGEAGCEGILCGEGHYPANAYADFQRAVLALRSRGILLAIASKNDLAQVEKTFRRRADLPLRAEHISAWEVHWGPKPESLRRIAARLNIGLESLVFLDDNPAEIDLVKMALPQVRAYRMPARPEEFIDFLAALEDFDQLQLSAEDTRRAELYELRRKQEELAAAATDLESFYRSLKTELVPEIASGANFDRVVQLFQKTNQFNLTTRRHDRAELTRRIERGSEVWAFRAKDIHGDHGIIAAVLLDFSGAECHIDSFLMSCRVIGRTLETAILHVAEERALARGARRLTGEYVPTARNGPCRDFYSRHGFSCESQSGEGSRWAKDVASRTPCPEWITIRSEEAVLTAGSGSSSSL